MMKFHRQDAHKKDKLDSRWRKPRGLQSKMRLQKRGYALGISVGYGNDNSKKHLVKGLLPVVVATLKELEAVDVKTQGAILKSTLGDRKREILLNKAKELKITILNVDSEKKLTSIANAKELRKQQKKQRADKKKSLEEKVKAPKKTDDKKEEKKTDEEKKEEMEAEKAKVLTHKQ